MRIRWVWLALALAGCGNDGARLQLLAGFVRVTDGAPGCQGFTPNSAANRLRRGNSLPGTANIIVARMSPTRDGHLACAA